MRFLIRLSFPFPFYPYIRPSYFPSILSPISYLLNTHLSISSPTTFPLPSSPLPSPRLRYTFILYQTLTPEDTLESVIAGGWKLIAPSAKVFEEWVSVLENNAMCIVTSHPPTVRGNEGESDPLFSFERFFAVFIPSSF